MTGTEFGRLGSRLLVLIFLLAGLSFVDSSKSSTAVAAVDDCYADCSRISRFCQAHPDGQYTNLDGINDCANFVSTIFCYTWDCPHAFTNKFTYSPCLDNPSLPDCNCDLNPYGPNCGNPTNPDSNTFDSTSLNCNFSGRLVPSNNRLPSPTTIG